ncbi:hypothetical protein PUNSTDRAFT_142595 [Punctularia strigosozonata HHB-11173 SS5]|uniref:uncharacterized protein n=1 Tax=Punctularia strigosozonata (strain HHB-11173) TaxID=741275 RepID=UPI000441850C|nr:uncharacterized protein PUNSTDRAFT_142595 [Punctularia strigosozonata HHB-11173 SS5]EIN10619.1 hypothetical protein PUNSTDRAFT_142595 [Punctularia strigosozonata HHB-11173 SS5]
MEPRLRGDEGPPARDDDDRLSPTSFHPRPPAGDTLAPLEFLQTQRRGSITDPQLHAAAVSSIAARLSPTQQLDPPRARKAGDSLPPITSPDDKPYLFPPSVTHPGPPESADSRQNLRNGRQPLPAIQTEQHNPAPDPRASHSASSPYPSGSKRKMSHDRAGFAPVGDDIDPQLVGPGMPSGMAVDPDGPSQKRRGSTIAAQNLSNLSLNDRRNSIAGNTGYHPSGFPADPPHGRLPVLAWPATQGQSHLHSLVHPEGDPNLNGPPRPFDSSAPPMSSIPGMPPYASDQSQMPAPPGVEPVSGPTRALRSRSRPASRAGEHLTDVPPSDVGAQHGNPHHPPVQSPSSEAEASNSSQGLKPSTKGTPYSRSPELRVSHKLAERKRRKEMKDLFDELRDHLPADRGMKASKWEILSKAIDFVAQMKQDHQGMMQEIEMLRRENESLRQGHGIPPFAPGVVYGAPPPMVAAPYPPPGSVPHHPPPHHPSAQNVPTQASVQPPPPITHPSQAPLSRPPSSQHPYPPGSGASAPQGSANGSASSAGRTDSPPS